MKKIFVLSCVAVSIIVASCKKEDDCPYRDSNVSAPQVERDSLTSYLNNNGIAFNEHPSGVFYNVAVPGSGDSATICSRLVVKYRGTYIPSGVEFDATLPNTTAAFQLGRVITGWQKSLGLIRQGGKITLYIPPTLAYGPNNVLDQNGQVVIPGNSYMKFDVELVDVQ
ncbi:MAG: FKBP-type peptidyl-prolyl cis-trans isomerase [Rhizobacter sp.]|nr:FKBP-type peptidyl-prolyl cis-trans isomerase [Ferruginibacter sp.]